MSMGPKLSLGPASERSFLIFLENALFDDIESARAYAMDKKIAKVVVIDESDEEEQE